MFAPNYIYRCVRSRINFPARGMNTFVRGWIGKCILTEGSLGKNNPKITLLELHTQKVPLKRPFQTLKQQNVVAFSTCGSWPKQTPINTHTHKLQRGLKSTHSKTKRLPLERVSMSGRPTKKEGQPSCTPELGARTSQKDCTYTHTHTHRPSVHPGDAGRERRKELTKKKDPATAHEHTKLRKAKTKNKTNHK